MVASGVDPPELMVFPLERFCCGAMFGWRRSWKMGTSPEPEGVGVGALLDARDEAGQTGESRTMRGTMFSLLVGCPTLKR